MKYIKPLDGLRAIAIILVLVFHLDESYLNGGFVGVDIFFTISGFIITLNLLNFDTKDKSTLFLFYKTRVARLLPSVLITVLVSLLAASFIYGTDAFSEYRTTASYAVLSLSNFYFIAHSGYFEDGSQANIFLHMWSLSVEEQFYLFWPFLIFAIAAYQRKSRAILAVVVVASLAGSWALSLEYFDMAFYLMPTRIFQFAMGAFLAHVFFVRKNNFKIAESNSWLSNAVFILGIATVLYSAKAASGANYEFFEAAVLPSLGACLIIMAINSEFSKTALGHGLMRFIGIRAYSLYLVHWPIIVMFGLFIGSKRSLSMNILIALLCFILAEILHRLVERPLRLSKDVSATNLNGWKLKLIGITTVCTVVISLYGLGKSGDLNSDSSSTAEFVVAPKNDDHLINQIIQLDDVNSSYTDLAAGLWQERTRLGRARKCQLQLRKPYENFDEEYCVGASEQKKLLIIGDSFTAETVITLNQVFGDDQLLSAGTSGYMPIYRENQNEQSGSDTLNLRRFQWVDRPDISAIVLVSNWQHWNRKNFLTTVEYLVSRNKPLIIIGIRPKFSLRIPTLMDGAAGDSAINNLNPYMGFDLVRKETMIREVVEQQESGVFYLDIMKYLCPDGVCSAVLEDGTLVYLDSAHMTAAAAMTLGSSINDHLGDFLRKFSNVE